MRNDFQKLLPILSAYNTSYYRRLRMGRPKNGTKLGESMPHFVQIEIARKLGYGVALTGNLHSPYVWL